jgi:exoribonuclease-2
MNADKEAGDIGIGALVLYKQDPAKVTGSGRKIDISLLSGKNLSVRPKDVLLLHPGPISSLEAVISSSSRLSGEVEPACEMLAGEVTDIAEFAELAYQEWTPQSAWAVEQMIQEGYFLTGSPWKIEIRGIDEREAIAAQRRQKEREAADWEAFLERVRAKALADDDRRRFFDVENLAFGQSTSSRLLKALGIKEEPEHAHAFLLRMGIWDQYVDPMPRRFSISPEVPTQTEEAPEIPDEPERIDLTGLRSFAIDDEGSRDPDDAVSIDGNTIWVHVADAAAVIAPGSESDERARERGTTHYLPEGAITMLDQAVTDTLALGLQDVSPALSIRIVLDDQAHITDTEICTSWIRAERLSYREVHDRLDEQPFRDMAVLLEQYEMRRRLAGSIDLNLPEVKVSVDRETGVSIRQLPDYDSKKLVSNAMVLAGEAASRFATERSIPFPYTVQMPPDSLDEFEPDDLAAMFAFVRKMRPSEVRMSPDVHAGLGLDSYTRVTSPLRRYVDLLAHQQLRLYLSGQPLIDQEQLFVRAQSAFEQAKNAQQAERAASLFWKLVYLLDHPDWKGEAVILSIRKQGAQAVIPELALEILLPGVKDVEINQRLTVSPESVDIAFQQAQWRVL